MQLQTESRTLRFDEPNDELCARIRDHLKRECPYGFAFRDITITSDDGDVCLTGRVQSFYLKQVLQTSVAKVGGVKHVTNETDVVCSFGRSSVRPR